MNRKLFDAQVAQYTTPTVSGEGSVAFDDNIRSYLPYAKVEGDTVQQTYEGYQQIGFKDFTRSVTDTDGNVLDVECKDGIITLNGKTNKGVAFTLDANYMSYRTLKAGTYTFTTAWVREAGTNGNFGNYAGCDCRYVDNVTGEDVYFYITQRTVKTFENDVLIRYMQPYTNANNELINAKFAIGVFKGDVATADFPPYEPYVGGIPSPNAGQTYEVTGTLGNINPTQYADYSTNEYQYMYVTDEPINATGGDIYEIWSYWTGTGTVGTTIPSDLSVAVAKNREDILTGNGDVYWLISNGATEENKVRLEPPFYLGIGSTSNPILSIDDLSIYINAVYDYFTLFILPYSKVTIPAFPQPIENANGNGVKIPAVSYNLVNKEVFANTSLKNEVAGAFHGSTTLYNAQLLQILKPNTTYTISFEAEGAGDIPDGATINNGPGFFIYPYTTGTGAPINFIRASTIPSNGEVMTFSRTITTSSRLYEDGVDYRLMAYTGLYSLDGTNYNASCIIRNVQIVEGSEAKPYKPYTGTRPSPFEDYQFVEYLQSTGAQYIDMDVVPDENTTVEIKFLQTANDKFPYGSRTSLSAKDKHTWNNNIEGIRNVYPQFGNSDTNAISLGSSFDFSVIHTLKNGKNGAYMDGTLIDSYNTTSFTKSALSMYLFALNTPAEAYTKRGFVGNIYSCKVWSNGVLIRDYMPCYRKSNNVAGMYDWVNNKFYTSLSNSFAKGPDVTLDRGMKIVSKGHNLLNKEEFTKEALKNETVLTLYGGRCMSDEDLHKILKPNTSYTFSFEVEGVAERPANSTLQNGAGFMLWGSGDHPSIYCRISEFASTGEIKKYSSIFTTSNDISVYNLQAYRYQVKLEDGTYTGVDCIIRNVQIVENETVFNKEQLINKDFTQEEYEGTDCIKVVPTGVNHYFDVDIPVGRFSLYFEYAHPDTASDFYVIAHYEDGTTVNLTNGVANEASTTFRNRTATKTITKRIVKIDIRFYSVASYRPYYFRNFIISIDKARPYMPYFENIINIPPYVTKSNGTILNLPMRHVPKMFDIDGATEGIDYLKVDRLANKVEYVRGTELYSFNNNNTYGFIARGNHVFMIQATFANTVRINNSAYCTKYIGVRTVGNLSNVDYGFTLDGLYYGAPRSVITVKDIRFDNATDFNNSLKDLPMEIVLCLAEPVTTDITDTDLGEKLLGLATVNGLNIMEIVGGSDNMVSALTVKYLTHV